MTSEPKIAIVGVGPVGGILGAHLAHAGHYVVLCDIQRPHLDAIKERGLSLTGTTEMTSRCERVAYSISELANFPTVNTIIVATKASILPRIVPQIKKVARSGVRFISCQNGLDNEEYLAETFGPDNVLRIVVNYAGSQMGDGHIAMSFFNPPNYIGAMTAQGEPLARQLAEMMTGADLETQFTAETDSGDHAPRNSFSVLEAFVICCCFESMSHCVAVIQDHTQVFFLFVTGYNLGFDPHRFRNDVCHFSGLALQNIGHPFLKVFEKGFGSYSGMLHDLCQTG